MLLDDREQVDVLDHLADVEVADLVGVVGVRVVQADELVPGDGDAVGECVVDGVAVVGGDALQGAAVSMRSCQSLSPPLMASAMLASTDTFMLSPWLTQVP
ncbi:hypothetical protein ACIOEX_01400 [Streptomyces sp. NPDC087850]|uniref:hypothetical protein n=1 Tax=Streptomyces sp. NPDC087850 TaxID=3365809 RepID=UPI003820C6C0